MAGGAAASVDWLRRHLAEFGMALSPDDIVIAGTPLGLYPVAQGDDVTVFLEDVPVVNCRVAA
jgi:2-keto-4-pentenoate hydratase